MSVAMQYISMGGATVLSPIPSAPAQYSGTTATTVTNGPSSGAQDIFMTVGTTDSTTAANLIRVFKGVGTILVPWGTYRFERRFKDSDSDSWNAPLHIPPIRLSASTEYIMVSQEKNDTCLILEAEKFNLG